MKRERERYRKLFEETMAEIFLTRGRKQRPDPGNTGREAPRQKKKKNSKRFTSRYVIVKMTKFQIKREI